VNSVVERLTDRQLVQLLGRVGLELLGRFPALRPSQRAAISPVFSGKSVILSCATASGKTEAVLAPLIARIAATNPTRDVPALVAIAPTRALVNDLYCRLQGPLARLGLSCARQSSDHRAAMANAFVLVTTPESLDSLLARRTVFSRDGKPVGHELSGIQALFIDEVHLFDNTARGDQLQWLIARLKRVISLREPSRPLQVCAASATVSEPGALASRLLGSSVQVVSVDGSRTIRLFSARPIARWEATTPEWDISRFRGAVNLLPNGSMTRGVCETVWTVLSTSSQQDSPRKLLLFTPTRALCDTLSLELNEFLHKKRQLKVLSHHGSLSKEMRERAEQEFNRSRDAVLVATTTLEVGIDIGDVDAVVLIGPASDTAGLLQRIGRSGRREGVTRVVACATGPMELAALASMLRAACNGRPDIRYQKRNWSVVVQQIASFTWQSGSQGRRISDLLQLACDTWGDQGRENTAVIVEHLVEIGLLSKSREDRLTPDGEWVKLWEGMGMHGNIGSNSSTVALVDSMTGMAIAEVPLRNTGAGVLNLAGKRWQTDFRNGELVAKAAASKDAGEGKIQYGGRQAPVTQAFGQHVAVGCGLGPHDLVQLVTNEGIAVFHFGGSAFEQALLTMPAFMHAKPLVRGICVLLGVGSRLDASAVRRQLPDSISPLQIDEGAWRKILPSTLPSESREADAAKEVFARWWRDRRWISDVAAEEENLLREIIHH
jgi:ATP-dependent Lhr-like helicase